MMYVSVIALLTGTIKKLYSIYFASHPKINFYTQAIFFCEMLNN